MEEDNRFKLPKIENPRNPLTNQGVKALIIVLAVILLISAIVYLNITRQRKESPPVLPAATQEEVTEEPTPTLEETPTAAASPTATVIPKVKVSE